MTAGFFWRIIWRIRGGAALIRGSGVDIRHFSPQPERSAGSLDYPASPPVVG